MTQAVSTIFHDLTWQSIDISSLSILLLKEALPSIPIILNLSLCIGWGLWKNELYRKKEVFSLWLSGWGNNHSFRFLKNSIGLTIVINTLILMVIMPMSYQNGPAKDQSWLEYLSHNSYLGRVSIPLTQQDMLLADGVVNGVLTRSQLVQFHNDKWSVIDSHSTRFQDGMLFFKDSRIKYPIDHDGNFVDAYLKKSQLTIPSEGTAHKKILKERLSFKDLYYSKEPRLQAELVWRLGLIFQSAIVLIPFRRVTPSADRTIYNTREIYKILSWFSAILMGLFFVTKQMNCG